MVACMKQTMRKNRTQKQRNSTEGYKKNAGKPFAHTMLQQKAFVTRKKDLAIRSTDRYIRPTNFYRGQWGTGMYTAVLGAP